MRIEDKYVNPHNNNILSDVCARIIDKSAAIPSKEEKMAILVEELHKSLDYFFWVGFYFPRDADMIIGPSAGAPACASIGYEGVCGKSFKSKQTIIVPDVTKFPGHITCDPDSKSEIAIPVRGSDNKLFAILDVDSDSLNAFTEENASLLENLLYQLFTAKS